MISPFRAVAWRFRAWRAVRRARRDTHTALARGAISRILVVCFGNIYRSAFVGEYLKQRLGPIIEVRSRGFHPQSDRSSPNRHVAMARDLGVELASHRSALIDAADLSWADLIVLMDRGNWARLRRMGADPSRLVWLGACAPGAVEIEDPYSLDDAGARQVLLRLRQCSQSLAESFERPKDGQGVQPPNSQRRNSSKPGRGSSRVSTS